MQLTYRNLVEHLQEMDEARLEDNVTIFDTEGDEFLPAIKLETTKEECDVLHEGHLVIVI